MLYNWVRQRLEFFDTFETAEGRQAHLNGQIAASLMANAAELLTKEPKIEMVDLIAIK